MLLRSADFRRILRPVGSWHCVAAFFSQVPVKCIDLDLTIIYNLIVGTYTRFEWDNKLLALGVYFPQPCSMPCWPHVSRIQVTFGLLPTNLFVSTRTNSMKCLVNWISLRICVRSRNTQPYLKGRPPRGVTGTHFTSGKSSPDLEVSHTD